MSSDLGDALGAAAVSPQELGMAIDAATGDSSTGGNAITKVTWHQNRPGQYQVVFRDGRELPQTGGRPDAKDLATSLEFDLTSDPIDEHLAEWSADAS